MGKRMTDTKIWDKEWFMKLDPKHKCAFKYITDKCDAVGVWDTNFTLAELQIGGDIEWDKLHEKFPNQIEVLPNGKWWVVDFVSFQYGELTETCNPHKKYIEMLKKHGLYERVTEGHNKGSNSVKEKKKEDTDLEKYDDKYSIHSTHEWDENQPIDYRTFVDFFNEISNANCRMTDNKRKDIQKQLKHFTGVEIKRALTNRSEILRDSEYLTSWESVFTRKIERMEKYLNANPSKSYNGKRKPSEHGFDLNKAQRDLEGI